MRADSAGCGAPAKSETLRSVLRHHLLFCLLLSAATLVAYARVCRFGFLNYDDPGQITQNAHVKAGLTWDGLIWAFTAFTEANWYPVTWLSHMACVQFAGLHAGFHHLVNVGIHAAAALALFGFLVSATDSKGPSAFVAAVFALHPLHVESVAWIAERKDVLCALFWFLALGAWVRDSGKRGMRRYAATLLWFALGLMSKPMIVTFPFTLLLLDFWPLRKPWTGKLLTGKLPFFALSAAGCAIAILAQKAGGAVQSSRVFSPAARIENAFLSVWFYVEKTFWPAGISLAYQWPDPLPAGLAAAGGVAIAVICAVTLRLRLTRPYLAFGWFWFLGTLTPAIGFVQVGLQSRADRYTYVPMVGLSVMVAWGAAEFAGSRTRGEWICRAATGAAVCAMAVSTFHQTGYWGSAESLFRHTLAVTGENHLAYTYLAAQLRDRPDGRAEALADLKAAARLNPSSAATHSNLGSLYELMGRTSEAAAEYREGVRLEPNDAQSHCGLGRTLQAAGETPEALEQFRKALLLAPADETVRVDAAGAFLRAGREADGIAILTGGLKVLPDSPLMENLLGAALLRSPGRLSEAVAHLERAVELAPGFPDAHNNLGVALESSGRPRLAIDEFEEAVRLKPTFADAQHNLGLALSRTPDRAGEASEHLKVARDLVEGTTVPVR